MHIRHSFDLRMFGKSLKRIGTAMKDAGASHPDRADTTDTPVLPTPPSDPTSTANPTDHPEPHDRLQHAALLTRLAIDLHAALDPAMIAHSVLVAIGLHSNAGTATIMLVGPTGAIELALSNSAGPPQPLPLDQAHRILEYELAGWDWRDSSSVLLAGSPDHQQWEGALSGSVLALPLARGPASFGVLVLSHPLPGHFSSQDLLLFKSVAAQASLALGVAGWGQASRQRPLFEQERTAPDAGDPMHIIFDHLPDGLVLIDPAGHILTANDAFCEDVLGITPGAVIGRQYATIIQELEQGEQITIEPHPSIPALRRARCDAADGRQHWYEIDRYAVAADDTEPVIERWRDITRQEEQQRELRNDERLTTMARLAANVVHEIGNPLQSVRSCIDLSREDRTLAAPTAEYLELASSELRRMSHILTQLRDLYRRPVNEANHE